MGFHALAHLFAASNVERMKHASPFLEFMLLAVNELGTDTMQDEVEHQIDLGKHVLIDSGVYALAMNHAKDHGLSHNEALGLAPEKVDGFAHLFELYVSVMKRFGAGSWGYIEIHQGGRENKIKTRAKLERLGLRPIPVYHPLNDGWEYFDYLAERYQPHLFRQRGPGRPDNAQAADRDRLEAPP